MKTTKSQQQIIVAALLEHAMDYLVDLKNADILAIVAKFDAPVKRAPVHAFLKAYTQTMGERD